VSNETRSILKAPIAGGPPTVLATGQHAGTGSGVATSLVVDDTYVYWMDRDNGVTRVPKDGGALSTLPSGLVEMFDLVSDGPFLYYVGIIGPVRLPKDGSPPTVLSCLGEGAVRVDDTYVYWAGGNGGSSNGVWRVAK
jgi:hypothetical protein